MSDPHVTWRIVLLVALIALFSGSMFLFTYYCGLRTGKAALAWVLTTFAAAGAGAWRASVLRKTGIDYDSRVEQIFSLALFIFLIIPFGIRLYRKWLGGALTEAEKSPGAPGIRAWLSPGNLIIALVISIAGWQAFGITLVLMFIVMGAVLVAWPVLNTQPQPVLARAPENLSAEREKVLAMLEAGKITAEESAELLNALGASVAPRVPIRAPLTPNGRLVLIGAALVTIGFFLPWFAFSPGAELSRMMGQFRAEGFPMPEMGGAGIPVKHIVQISGGSVANGLGWAVLLLGLLAALLPQVAQTVDAATQRTVRFLALGAGTILVLYLATQSLRAVAFGLCVTIAGYALEWLGISREQSA